jgi:hypothetical protein
MAQMLSGFPWHISGKVGDRVYYMKNGKNYSRKLPVRKKRDPEAPLSPIQLKFLLLTKFFKPITPLFRQSFELQNTGMSGFNKAMSLNMQKAITGEFPDFSIDFSNVILGNGSLAPPPTLAVFSSENGKLNFFWTTTSGRGSLKSKDFFYVAIFCESLNKWFYVIDNTSALKGAFELHAPEFSGCIVHTYMGFISEFGNSTSMSGYGGLVGVV